MNGNHKIKSKEVLSCHDVWFRYEKKGKDILKGVNISLKEGETYSLLAGNGTGKTTLLSILCELSKPYAGNIIKKGKTTLLMQNPKNLFTKNTIREELASISPSYEDIIEIFELEGLLDSHPFDISGGEEERLGLAKIFLTESDIYLLDEPTKGLDHAFKNRLVNFIQNKKKEHKSFFIVTHDMEFAARVSDRCGMLFQGEILAESATKTFFRHNQFYTTDISRMTKEIVPNVITYQELQEEVKHQ